MTTLRSFVYDVCKAHGGSVTSWVRSVVHNANVGGVKNSKHLLGLAFDVVYDATPPDESALRSWAHSHGVKLVRETKAGAFSHDHFEYLD